MVDFLGYLVVVMEMVGVYQGNVETVVVVVMTVVVMTVVAFVVTAAMAVLVAIVVVLWQPFGRADCR